MSRPWKNLEELCHALGGKRPLQRILVANNGLAAVKGIRSIQQWLYDHLQDMNAVHFVVMASPECIRVNAEHIKLGDETVPVPSGKNVNNYANVELIFSIATQRRCDAVYVGWGHASENPALPKRLLEETHGAVEFMGPPEGPMRDLGDKIASSIIAQAASVPTLPWSGMDIRLPPGTKAVSKDCFEKACVNDAADARRWADRIGYPVMLKASEGGGGKGIRKVFKSEEITEAFHAVQVEVKDSPVFVMKMASNVRHIEVQLLADKYNNVIALRTRECSVQRRQQKIIEEGPAFNIRPGVTTEMEASAVRLAKLVGYVGLGTVEFLYAETGQFYFLELNPRIQVEHPVTEMVTGVNLPAALLCVSMGIPLHRIPEVRQWYGLQDIYGDSPLPYERAHELTTRCHTIAVRITAEDPDEGFQPCTGSIDEIVFRNSRSCWGYFSLSTGGGVHEFSDSQFGHIFASGATREDARKAMIMGLRNLSIRGDVRTTTHYVAALLELKEFMECTVNTAWLDGLIATKFKAKAGDVCLSLIAAVVHKFNRMVDHQKGKYMSFLNAGHIPNVELLPHELSQTLVIDGIKYEVKGQKCGPSQWCLTLNDNDIIVPYREFKDKGLQITVHERTFVAYVEEDPGGLRVSINNQSRTFSSDMDPTQLRSSVPGRLVRFTVTDGQHVTEGQAFAEVEVMKMLLPLRTSLAGVIKIAALPGTTIPAGKILAQIIPDDPNVVKMAKLFAGTWPPPQSSEEGRSPAASSMSPFKQNMALTRARTSVDTLYCLLQGYSFSSSTLDERLKNALDGLSGFSLSSITFDSLRCEYFPAVSVCPNNASDKLKTLFHVFFQIFFDVERWFDGCSRHEALHAMRLKIGEEITVEQSFEVDFAHSSPQRQRVLKGILSFVEKDRNLVLHCSDVLQRLAGLRSQSLQAVLLYSRYLLRIASMPTIEERRSQAAKILENGAVDTPIGLDMLCSFLDQQAPHLTPVAFEAFLRTIYTNTYTLTEIDIFRATSTSWRGLWKFSKNHEGSPFRHEGIVGAPSVEDLSALAAAHKAMHVEEVSKGTGHLMMVSEAELSTFLLEFFNSFLTNKAEVSHFAPMRDVQPAVALIFVSGRQDNSAAQYSDKFRSLLVEHKAILENSMPRLAEITFVVVRTSGTAPYMFTYRHCDGYTEDTLIRNIPPTIAFMLELPRLRRYELEMIPNPNPKVHVYFAKERTTGSHPAVGTQQSRVFVRTMVLADDLDVSPGTEITDAEAGRVILSAITALEISRTDDRRLQSTAMNHFFVHCLDDITMNPHKFREFVRNIERAYGPQLFALGVRELEVKFKAQAEDIKIPLRAVISNVTGHFLSIDLYAEVEDDTGLVVLKSMHDDDTDSAPPTPPRSTMGSDSPISPPTPERRPNRSMSLIKLKPAYSPVDFQCENHPVSGQPILSPYPVLSGIMKRRLVAQNTGTTYVHDWPILFNAAIRMQWKLFKDQYKDQAPLLELVPMKPLRAEELFLSHDKTKLEKKAVRSAIGMCVWEVTVFTPLNVDAAQKVVHPQRFLLIANDITHQIGSFSVIESETFAVASRLAREKNIPFVYVSCNSGARLGLASEVKEKLRIQFKPSTTGDMIFDYLYLSENDYAELGVKKHAVQCVEHKLEDGTVHYRLTDVIGNPEENIGVENLKGSGTIAGEMSLNYDTIPTISVVSGRSVGIGAYLVRLGHRVIQTLNSPIILTGANALNRVLGKEVYTSNNQLGGNQIMQPNGVTHWEAKDDMDAVKVCLTWLESQVTSCVNGVRGVTAPLTDPIDREVTFCPVRDEPYDPRCLIDGNSTTNGMFDKGSFVECMADWAKSVVTGRARLGGIPCGVIAVETRVTRKFVPADPADPSSSSQVLPQAGQVWFPDSAHKTADALSDFRREKLPCFILANWRGFSGGMRDMFDEVLKHGAHIVDNLRVYDVPIFIYMPPCAELRGGAWVVLDPAINHCSMLEMYSDTTARGGILEPSGVVEIKFRDKDINDLILRTDAEAQRLQAIVRKSAEDPTNAATADATLKQRLKHLRPIYEDIAVQFADMHDTPGRMKAKGCIRQVVPWAQSRKYFYNRLRRRLVETELCRTLTQEKPLEYIHGLLVGVNLDNDVDVTEALLKEDGVVQAKIKAHKGQLIMGRLKELIGSLAGVEGWEGMVAEVIDELPQETKTRMFSMIGGSATSTPPTPSKRQETEQHVDPSPPST
eukprot:PhF_6_TR8015/c0_g1_i3/m.12428/K11262/ACACA; acetyl-CoA carboxylase / biotin carboxylase 1